MPVLEGLISTEAKNGGQCGIRGKWAIWGKNVALCVSNFVFCVYVSGFSGCSSILTPKWVVSLVVLLFLLNNISNYLDRLGLSGCKVTEAPSGQNKGQSVSRSFPCWPNLLAPDNENVKSKLPLVIFTPLLPCSVPFLNLPVWGFPALWVGWVHETEGVLRWWSWW